ncbi:MAG: transcription termination/antitermination protein NusG, partial [Spirochaetes bacterium]|nr:transcription termination/antitermination protein NusG [Spirochaetota bacterium]
MTKGWYVIHTYSGHENKVKLALEKKVQNLNLGDKIFQVKIPTVEEHSVKDGKKIVKPKKIFPGYVLVEMILDDETWMAIKSIPG